MNWLIFMKIVAKCAAIINFSFKAHVKVYDPIPLKDCIHGFDCRLQCESVECPVLLKVLTYWW